ncbi:hypothetical protein CkaCkLH20_11187 [Colletotrichum karsti]|uniref:Uncharacterized protein n=1 Tax=Colletotrichum karsti TaxID=1095194 RepID=A0A9P6HZJ0_9PEZI|nr:uncharacterized protein CkaCkLH20_11187 [Colletotrichum karsti]KAF9871266.1 hypothetical protein CkaCkLH20_11187 [Colletotrichum karsti]
MSSNNSINNDRADPLSMTTWLESLRAAKARGDFEPRGKSGPLNLNSCNPVKTDQDHFASLHQWWTAAVKVTDRPEPQLRGILPPMGFVNDDLRTIPHEEFAAAVKAMGNPKPRVKNAPPAMDCNSSTTNDDGWTIVKNKHSKKFVARSTFVVEHPESEAEEAPEQSTPGGTPPPSPSPSPTEAVVELEYNGEDEYSGDEVTYEHDDDGDGIDAEAATCDDVADEYCYDGFRADYDALVVEENKMMDQVVYDFVNRNKYPHYLRHKQEFKRRGQRKRTVERRHQRSDKKALN